MHHTLERAFSLTELLIVMAVVGVLVVISYPIYREQVFKGRRTDAKQSLTALAHQLERCRTRYYRYNHPACTSHLDCLRTAGQALVPDGLTISAPSCEGRYAISSQSPGGVETLSTDGESYTLYAIPQGNQSRDARCAVFELAGNGVRAAHDAAGADATATCW